MIENNSEKKTFYYCENCDTTLSIGSIAKINNDHSTLFCELCGDKLLEKEKITKPLHSTHEVSDNLLYKNIFVDDKRFSKDFKGDLVSAISRIIYIKLKAAALKNNLDFTQINLENNFKNGLADYLLTEITSEQIISCEYLSETPNFQPTDFNHIYTQFQSAVKSDEMYAKGIRQYLFWLIGNIYDISSGNKTKFSPFERVLTDELKNIDESEEKFRNHNPNIIKSEAENPHERNSKSEDFKNKKTLLSNRKRKRERKTLIYDDIKGIKECGHCHRILPFSNFYRSQTKCNECINFIKKINRYRKKFRLINEFFSGKCHKCGQDLNFLSIAHFHHPLKKSKTAEWTNMQGSSYSNILDWAQRDKIIPLCNNCHKKEEASIFYKFKDLILKPNLFSMSAAQIDQLLIVGKWMTSNEKTKIQKWTRKRYIIEKIFGGHCIGCEEVTIFTNLPSLSFHHRDPAIKNVGIEEIFRGNDCKTIYEIILKEAAVCLCANCHSLLDTDLQLHLDNIFNNTMENFKKNYKEMHRKLINNINNFKFKQLEVKSPLKLEFGHKEIWELNLLEAYFFLQENQFSNFWTSEFIKSFNYERQYANEIMNKLEKKGYLRKVTEKHHIQVKYEMTKKGKNIVKDLIEKHKTVSKMIQERAKLQEHNFLDESERTLSYNDVIKRYPFHIFKIILQNGFNEFTIVQLSEKVEKLPRTINKNFIEKLIPEGIVEKVEMPLYIQIFQYNNVFRLTNKGYKLIKEYFKKSPTFEEINKFKVKKIRNDLIRYSIFIFNLIQDKGFNEFIKKEIYELAQTEQKDLGRFTGYLMRTQLIPEGIIKEVKDPQFISKDIPATKIYELHEKGIEIAKNIMNNQLTLNHFKINF
jgi:Mn-dependent DtxR family transcriptional regulator